MVLAVLIILAVIAAGVLKMSTYEATKCIHCGHDSGRSGLQAPVCPACGRNRTVINNKKARKR